MPEPLFQAYAAAIGLGGAIALCLILLFRHRDNIPHWLAGLSLLVFASATLISPPASFLIAAGLGLMCIWKFRESGLAPSIRLLSICTLIGLPSLLVMTPYIALYPHKYMGAPHRIDLILPPPHLISDQIGFIASQTIRLAESITAPNPRLLSGPWATVWTWVGIGITAIGIALTWKQPNKPEYRFASRTMLLSLLPVAILGAMGWYPYGEVHYEGYVVVIFLVFAAVGAEQIRIWILSRVSLYVRVDFAKCALALLFLSSIICLSAWTGKRMVVRELQRKNDYETSLKNFRSAWNNLSPQSVVLTRDSRKMCLSAGLPVEDPLFIIPQNARMSTQETLHAFSSCIESHNEIKIYVSRPLSGKSFDPYTSILRDLNFQLAEKTPGRWSLQTWRRTK